MHFIRKLAAGVAFLGIVTAVGVAVAQQPQFGTRNPAPRFFPTQQVHYLRFTVNFNDCGLVAVPGPGTTSTCSVKRGAVPYNAWIARIQQQIITNFNAGTTDDVAIGTLTGVCPTQANNGGITGGVCGATTGLIMQNTTVHSGAGGATAATVNAISAGTNATGAGDASTGANGGFDIWTQYDTGGTAPTAGQVVYVIEYIAPNDGSCVQPALGSVPTPNAC
jgi:hypothetical protein